MFFNTDPLKQNACCQISGLGHTDPSSDPGYEVLSQADFIRQRMPGAVQREMFQRYQTDDPDEIAAKWVKATGIERRPYFNGPIQDMATIAARRCLANAGVCAYDLDAILVATNTGTDYPTIADHVKLALGERSRAMTFKLQAACPSGVILLQTAWHMIVAGHFRHVLVISADKATELAPPADYLGHNLFGDLANAILLSAGKTEDFLFFSADSLPFDGGIDAIVKDKGSFKQDGRAVHSWVSRDVVNTVIADLLRADIAYDEIAHIIPHQPSQRTLDSFCSRLLRQMPGFQGQIHNRVAETGNSSTASYGYLLSRGVHEGLIQSGEIILISAFGSGRVKANTAFRLSL